MMTCLPRAFVVRSASCPFQVHQRRSSFLRWFVLIVPFICDFGHAWIDPSPRNEANASIANIHPAFARESHTSSKQHRFRAIREDSRSHPGSFPGNNLVARSKTSWDENSSKAFASLKSHRHAHLRKTVHHKNNRSRGQEPLSDGAVEGKFMEFEKRKWLHIFESMTFFDWAMFFCFASAFLIVYHSFVMGLPAVTRYHGLAIFGWISVAVFYNILVFLRLGREASLVWLNGYLMELIFSLENVFVFHIIIEAFGTPTVSAQKALFLIVCCQVIFEVVLYMGVADVIDSFQILPYILGVWLVYLGIHSAVENDDHSNFDILETGTVKTLRRFFGERLVLEYDTNSCIFTTVTDAQGNKRYGMTMLGLVFIILLMADFFLEIDVTLTKIEASEDEYLSFTSSALAGFAVPELFFVARDLFRCFPLLKYGISFVLVFYGSQMLFPGVLRLSPIEGCGLIVVIMALCIVLSVLTRKGRFSKNPPRLSEDLTMQAKLSNKSISSCDGEYGSTGAFLKDRKNLSFVFEDSRWEESDSSEQAFESSSQQQKII